MVQFVLGLFMIGVFLVGSFYVYNEGIVKGTRELGQKQAVQISTTESDPNNGTIDINAMQEGTSDVDIE